MFFICKLMFLTSMGYTYLATLLYSSSVRFHRQQATSGYSRQRRTIGTFSATAGLLVRCMNLIIYNDD